MTVRDTIYQKLADRILMSGSEYIPELFAMVATPDEARLLLVMPGTPQELTDKVGLSLTATREMCEALYQKGLAFKSHREGQVRFKMCKDIVQFHDATILWTKAPKAFHDLWQQFMDEEWPYFARFAEAIYPKPQIRVIPVNRSIDVNVRQKILDADSMERIIEDAELLAVTKCTCRLISGKCDHPLEVCLQVNNGARYNLDRGTGREITKEEALEIIKDCEEKGLVHLTMNTSPVGNYICNCCECCCQSFTVVIKHGTKLADPSRFCAHIDSALCTFCETCLDRCHFGTINPVTLNGNEVCQVTPDKCMGCGLCEITCPSEAITMKEVRPQSFIPPAKRRSEKSGRKKPSSATLVHQIATTALPLAIKTMKAYDKVMAKESVKSLRQQLEKWNPLKGRVR